MVRRGGRLHYWQRSENGLHAVLLRVLLLALGQLPSVGPTGCEPSLFFSTYVWYTPC